MHLDTEQVQRLLHGELDPASRDQHTRHLAECEACRQLVDAARREEQWIVSLIRQVDHPVPQVELPAPIKGDRVSPRWGSLAAGIVLAMAVAGIAYAAPGSPLPRWIEQAARWLVGSAAAPDVVTPDLPAVAPSGIAVTPAERFTIRFAGTQGKGTAIVSFTDQPEVTIRSYESGVRFTAEPERLLVENTGANADYEIELPRAAPWIEIQVGDHRLALKQGQDFRMTIPRDSAGRYLLSLVGE